MFQKYVVQYFSKFHRFASKTFRNLNHKRHPILYNFVRVFFIIIFHGSFSYSSLENNVPSACVELATCRVACYSVHGEGNMEIY